MTAHPRKLAPPASSALELIGDTPMLELTGFDSQGSPQESLTQLKTAIDRGIRYVIQGNSSSVALTLSDAIGKYNQRNPGREVVYLNYGAVDPALTAALED